MEKIAKWKLLSDRKYSKYDPNNKHHIFAALFFCVTLNVYLENLVSFLLVQMTINFYLRVVITIDQNIDILYTSTSFKLVLAFAAINLLCKRNKWIASNKTLMQQLY